MWSKTTFDNMKSWNDVTEIVDRSFGSFRLLDRTKECIKDAFEVKVTEIHENMVKIVDKSNAQIQSITKQMQDCKVQQVVVNNENGKAGTKNSVNKVSLVEIMNSTENVNSWNDEYVKRFMEMNNCNKVTALEALAKELSNLSSVQKKLENNIVEKIEVLEKTNMELVKQLDELGKPDLTITDQQQLDLEHYDEIDKRKLFKMIREHPPPKVRPKKTHFAPDMLIFLNEAFEDYCFEMGINNTPMKCYLLKKVFDKKEFAEYEGKIKLFLQMKQTQELMKKKHVNIQVIYRNLVKYLVPSVEDGHVWKRNKTESLTLYFDKLWSMYHYFDEQSCDFGRDIINEIFKDLSKLNCKESIITEFREKFAIKWLNKSKINKFELLQWASKIELKYLNEIIEEEANPKQISTFQNIQNNSNEINESDCYNCGGPHRIQECMENPGYCERCDDFVGHITEACSFVHEMNLGNIDTGQHENSTNEENIESIRVDCYNCGGPHPRDDCQEGPGYCEKCNDYVGHITDACSYVEELMDQHDRNSQESISLVESWELLQQNNRDCTPEYQSQQNFNNQY